ncbi:hypothetical protein AK812_SmicGene30058 [Symbiodinium microadriaticum]|uniref:Uncharacterized protein n=1 Tax=Symbiodinium microadriaticum TaxID=2951 RepID=A0A1Q9D0A6_SYMMI|nr:hypothetical protein AK812_SmicGene30058 [Symbiodinium microadriaticum]
MRSMRARLLKDVKKTRRARARPFSKTSRAFHVTTGCRAVEQLRTARSEQPWRDRTGPTPRLSDQAEATCLRPSARNIDYRGSQIQRQVRTKNASLPFGTRTQIRIWQSTVLTVSQGDLPFTTLRGFGLHLVVRRGSVASPAETNRDGILSNPPRRPTCEASWDADALEAQASTRHDLGPDMGERDWLWAIKTLAFFA